MSSLTGEVTEELRDEVFEILAKEEKQALKKRLRDWKILKKSNIYLWKSLSYESILSMKVNGI